MLSTVFMINLQLILIVLVESQESYNSLKSCGKSKPILYKESNESQRLVEIVFLNNRINDCFIYGNKLLAENSISIKLCKPKVEFVEKKVLSEKALQCSGWLLKSMRGGNLPTYSDPDFPSKFNNKIDRNFFNGILIYPGTKWCGAGHSAEDYDDLGKERETDMCCRTHDNCPDKIYSGEDKYNFVPRCHCDCDQELYRCFKSVNKSYSKRMAQLFFNLLRMKCFKKDYPIVRCLEYKGIAKKWQSCQKYELDYDREMLYQSFDAMYF